MLNAKLKLIDHVISMYGKQDVFVEHLEKYHKGRNRFLEERKIVEPSMREDRRLERKYLRIRNEPPTNTSKEETEKAERERELAELQMHRRQNLRQLCIDMSKLDNKHMLEALNGLEGQLLLYSCGSKILHAVRWEVQYKDHILRQQDIALRKQGPL